MAKSTGNNVSQPERINGGKLYYLGECEGDTKVLIFGNSITRHSANEQIGWLGDFGMAASKKENDYVHVLYRLMKGNGQTPYFLVSQVADFEANFLQPDSLSILGAEKNFYPDILILRLGDNIFPFEDKSKFFVAFSGLIQACRKADTKVIVTGSYFENVEVEPLFQMLSEDNGYKFVELCDISKDESNWGGLDKYKHKGVAMHPGDKGMKIIAERLFSAINK